MSTITLLDTSVYLNILDVPGCNQQRQEVYSSFAMRLKREDIFFLPIATIWETGNHIANIRDGRVRRDYGLKFTEDVRLAIEGNTPYRATYFPEWEIFGDWLKDFPEMVMINTGRNGKEKEGISLSDHTIIKEWERRCSESPMSNVEIWSLDQHLSSYSRIP